MGDDLNSLLPVEYCYLTDEVLYPFFMQRYVENACNSSTPIPVRTVPTVRRRKRKSVPRGLISFVWIPPVPCAKAANAWLSRPCWLSPD